MPITFALGNSHSDSRINFFGLLTEPEIYVLASNPSLRFLQFDQPVDPKNWSLLERLLFSNRPDVALRVYGHHKDECDLSFLAELPSLRRFYADCLNEAVSLETIKELHHLEHLSIGVELLESFDFLNSVTSKLKSLSLGPTISSKPTLSVIPRFSELRELGVSGHTKGLDLLAAVPSLETLRFSCLKSPNIEFLSELPRLCSLSFLLGGSEDLSAIAHVKGLKDLELTRIRRLHDISFISRCIELQRLVLDQLRQVEHLPDMVPLTKLRRLTVADLKGLKSFDPLGAAPALEVFSGSSCGLKPEQFRTALSSPSMRRATVYFSSQKDERTFKEIAAVIGVSTETKWEEFIFN
jgi:hypothetical protein